MALRSNSIRLRSMLSRLTRNTTFATSTTPKMKPKAPAADHFACHPDSEVVPMKGDFVPVCVAIGMILLSVGFGGLTAIHQLKRAPNVSVKKSRRETLPEMVEPEHVAEEGDRFSKESILRKVAHIQDIDHKGVVPDPIRGDVYAQPRPRAITLKDVGVDPRLPRH